MVKKREKKNLIIICGGEKEDLSFKELHSQLNDFKNLPSPQTELVHLQRDSLKKDQTTLDETLKDYALKRESFKEIAVVILRSEMIEGLIGLGDLLIKVPFVLLKQNQMKRFFALTFLQTGKAHLELKT